MGKCVAYVAAAVVFMGIGALIAGACVWFLVPREMPTPSIRSTRYAECVFGQNEDGVSGTVHFQQNDSGPNNTLIIRANITGVSDGPHGFHIHQWGVPADGNCVGCGGHYNPWGAYHGSPSSTERHIGDLGNINATDFTQVEIDDRLASLWGDESIVGRAIVVHEGEDDLGVNDDTGSKTTGNAGRRLACCTIYLVKA